MAKKKRLLWHLFSSYLIIAMICVGAAIWYASTSLKDFLLKEVENDLGITGLLVRQVFLQAMDPLNEQAVNRLCKDLGDSVATRFTVILPSGKVVGDSDEEPVRMDNHLDRPEVSGALKTGRGVSIRYSHTMGRRYMYVAVPLQQEGRILGLVRAATALHAVYDVLEKVQLRILWAGLVIAGLAVALSFLFSHRIRRPVEEMKKGAEAFARGDFQHKLAAPEIQELASLCEAMNRMAEELQGRFNIITEQRSELGAVLSSMAEGVFGVDMEERIVNMNHAASVILGCDREHVRGRSVQEAIRNPSLQRFIQSALAQDRPVEEDILFYGDKEQYLSVHGTPLRNAGGQRSGVLVVLHDVTRLRRLENIRRDFVANVSHEIKTPITAIKGFVETLRDGAVKDPRDATRFLQIIQRHVERLESLVEDLLSLSRIEREAEAEETSLEVQDIRDVLSSAIQLCQVKASGRNIQIGLHGDPSLKANINASLLEQAVVNLLDNAITYSEEGKSVDVDVAAVGEEILIQVRDNGCGIEKIHLERLFERFYRVDKARSRNMGGTGLGHP